MKRAKVDLRGVGARVERWRQERAHARVPVPEELWNAAVEVARREGVHATAKALRFDYYGLKARLEGASTSADAPKQGSTAFVEVAVPSPDVGGSPALVGRTAVDAKGETVVELVGRHGDRMRIVAAHAVDIVGLAQAFWGRAS